MMSVMKVVANLNWTGIDSTVCSKIESIDDALTCLSVTVVFENYFDDMFYY